jgi:hypothetical protein
MKKDILNETFNKHTFLLKKKLYEQGVIQQQPIQEVELEEGFKDIALATLLGLGTLFNTTSKADTASPTNQPAVSVSSEINRVKSAKQKAEGVATEIAKKMIDGNNFSKSSAQKILDDVIKFNNENKFGSRNQMRLAIGVALSNNHKSHNAIGTTDATHPDHEELISKIPGMENMVNYSGRFVPFTADIGEAAQDILVKRYKTSDREAARAVMLHCISSATGDFMQMVAQKIVDNATQP